MESKAVQDVVAERNRQISEEGWSPENDDDYRHHELAIAAACYAAPGAAEGFMPGEQPRGAILDFWPWRRRFWKPKDRRRDLVRAAALLIAEIERLDRLEGA